jgi:tRNA threonylcarbamoyl adenosine modification protein (Sua5/YciO/YrdC/YwlC family)
MSQFFTIHAENPQLRLIKQAAEIIREGGLIVYPTDSSYALGCQIGDKTALARVQHIRQLDKNHNFTLVCRDLSEIATYAKVDNVAFRAMKALTPGAFTFILKATHEVPRRLQNPKRKTIGIRIPNHPVVQALLAQLNEPLISSTLILPHKTEPETEPEAIRQHLEKQVELIIDAGHCGYEPSTVIELTDGNPCIARQGKGQTDMFGFCA